MRRGSIFCTPCADSGIGISEHGNNACQACPAGRGANAERTKCVPCGAGEYSRDGVCQNCTRSPAYVPCCNKDNACHKVQDGKCRLANQAVGCTRCGNNQVVDPNDPDRCVCAAGTYDAKNGFVFCWPEAQGHFAGAAYTDTLSHIVEHDTLKSLDVNERTSLDLSSSSNNSLPVCVDCPKTCTQCNGSAPRAPALGASTTSSNDYVKRGWGFGTKGGREFHGINAGNTSREVFMFELEEGVSKPLKMKLRHNKNLFACRNSSKGCDHPVRSCPPSLVCPLRLILGNGEF